MKYADALTRLRKKYGTRARAKATSCSKAGIKRKRECRVGYWTSTPAGTRWTGHGETWEAALLDDLEKNPEGWTS